MVEKAYKQAIWHQQGKRSTYRLIAWETGTNATQALESKLGCQPIGPGPTNASGSSEQAWLDRSLGDSARNWEEAERRLRIIWRTLTAGC